MSPAVRPNSVALIKAMTTSPTPVIRVIPATNAPGVTCWKYTEKKKPPNRPTRITSDDSSSATVVAARTRGTTSVWIGLIPITRSASSSSRMVRAPRSAHIAVAPAPATTSTVTIGPVWLTVPNDAPVPEKSAAPNSTSSTLKVNTVSTVNGIDSINVGTSETLATNHVCRRYSRHANGRWNMHMNVSSAIAKKPPRPRRGLVATPREFTTKPSFALAHLPIRLRGAHCATHLLHHRSDSTRHLLAHSWRMPVANTVIRLTVELKID